MMKTGTSAMLVTVILLTSCAPTQRNEKKPEDYANQFRTMLKRQERQQAFEQLSQMDQATLERTATGFHYRNSAIGLSFHIPSTWRSVAGRWRNKHAEAVAGQAMSLNELWPGLEIDGNAMAGEVRNAVYFAVRPSTVSGETRLAQFGFWATPLADLATPNELAHSTVDEVLLRVYSQIISRIPGAEGKANAVQLPHHPDIFSFSYSLPSPPGTHRHYGDDFFYKYGRLLVHIKVSRADPNDMADIMNILETVQISPEKQPSN